MGTQKEMQAAGMGWQDTCPDTVPDVPPELAAPVPAAPEFPPPKPPGFIRRHLRGDYSLARSYWLHTFAIQLVMAGLLVLAPGLLVRVASARSGSAVLVGLFVLTLVVWTWAVYGTWASAGKHVSRGGSAGWAAAAKFVIVLGILRTAAEVVQSGPSLQEHLQVALGQEHGEKPKFEVRADGRSILLVGGIQDGTAEALEAALQAAPTVKTVSLQSAGGWVHEGERVGQVIRRRGLDTYVEGMCASACTLAFLGGVNRAAAPSARLGFHAPRPIGGGNLPDPKMRGMYQAAGLPAAFVERAMRTPHADMWFPTHDELLASGVVTRRSGGGETAAFATATRSRKELEDGIRKVELFALFSQREPAAWNAAIDDAWARMQKGATDAEVTTTIRNRVMPAIVGYLPHAGDEVLIAYHALMVEQLAALRARDLDACLEFAFPGGNYRKVLAVMPRDLREREVQLLTRMLKEYESPRPAPTRAQKEQVTSLIFAPMPQSQLKILVEENVRRRSRPAEVCDVAVAYFDRIGAVPADQRGQLLRTIYAN